MPEQQHRPSLSVCVQRREREGGKKRERSAERKHAVKPLLETNTPFKASIHRSLSRDLRRWSRQGRSQDFHVGASQRITCAPLTVPKVWYAHNQTVIRHIKKWKAPPKIINNMTCNLLVADTLLTPLRNS